MLSKDKFMILIAIIIGVGTLTGMTLFAGYGNVRHVPITWKEKIVQTIAFEEINGKIQLRGISGIDGEPNPHLVTRTNFVYVLTIINNGEKQHRFFIEGLNIESNLLEPGQADTLKIYPTKEGIYKYYDKLQVAEPLGVLEVRSVIPSDEFTGFLHDLI